MRLIDRNAPRPTIPEGWEIAPFEKVFERINAKKHQVFARTYSEAGSVPVVDQGPQRVVGYSYDEAKRFTPPLGGIIIFGDHTRVVKYVDFDFVVGADGTQILRGRAPQHTQFLAYMLSGTEIPNTGYDRHFKHIKGAVYLLPPIVEQHAIAEALGDVDALIGALDALIAKKRDVKRGAMQRLLTGATRLPGFTEPWETVRLGSLARIVSGGTPRSGVQAYWDGGIAWCVPTDITGCAGKHLHTTERTISAAGLKSSSATLLPAGTILLCSRATIGDVRIASVPMATNQNIKSMVANDGVSGEFLYYLITTLKERMIELSSGSTFLGICKAALSGIEVRIPSDDDERQAIAAVLSDMDAEIEALQARRTKTADLKKGMMRDLLTGRVRLTGTGEKRAMEAAE